MDQVEELLWRDPLIKGMWCVPEYSNLSGIVHSDTTVKRIAKLGNIASNSFRIFWDNAYAVHHLVDVPPQLTNIIDLSEEYGTLDNVYVIGSTSKITFAGAGMAFLASSEKNIKKLADHLSYVTTGPDKLNQLRQVRFLKDKRNIDNHMAFQRAILKPKFELVLKHLNEALADHIINAKPIGLHPKADTLFRLIPKKG